MAKFTHLPRHHRTSSAPHSPPKAEQPHQISISGIPEQHPATEIADAEFLINRVSGSCATKAAYTTRSEVTTYLRQTGFPGLPYTCQFCGFWHVTTMSKKAQKTLLRKLRAAKKLLDSTALSQ
jgi:hypothetical protein